MDVGRLLLSRTLQDQNLTPLLDGNILPERMPTSDDGLVLRFMLDFYREHSAVPSPSLVSQRFPEYIFPYAPDPASFYAGEVKKLWVRSEGQDVVLKQMKLLGATNVDPFDVIGYLRSAFSQLMGARGTHRDKRVEENVLDRWARYVERKSKVGLLGIPTPWDTLNDLTQGLLPEMYFGYGGRPGTGKTWAMLLFAIVAWLEGYRVLFVNKELSDELMERRFDAILYRLPYEQFRKGMLTEGEEARYREGLANFDARKGFMWLHGANTVSAIEAKVDDFAPELVIVDGAYLLLPEREQRFTSGRERNEHISRNLKDLSQRRKLPLGISVQLNRGAELKARTSKNGVAEIGQGDVFGSDAYMQDVDVFVALEQTEDMRLDRRMKHVVLKSREAGKETFLSQWDFDEMCFDGIGTLASVIIGGDENGGTSEVEISA
jgi:replicative DNA helicase